MDSQKFSRETRVPASPTQWKFWKVHDLEPATNADNMIVKHTMTEWIDTSILKRAIVILTSRHEALRTSFEAEGGTLFQAISAAVDLSVTPVEIAGTPDRFLATADSVATLQRIMDAPFDFTTAPLLRAALVTFSESATKCVLLVTSHAIVDGWSLGVIRRELREVLAALRDGEEVHMRTAKQFSQVMAERTEKSSRLLYQQEDYWIRQLSGVRPELSLPLQRSRQDVRREALRDLPIGRWEPSAVDAPPSILYIAALTVSLAKYATNGEIVIGNVYSNRISSENQSVVGLLFNVLPIRITVGDNPTVLELLRRVRNVTFRAYRNGEFPMEVIARHLGFGQAVFGGGSPLWEVAVNLIPSQGGDGRRHPRASEFYRWLWSIRRDPVMERWDGRILEIIASEQDAEAMRILRYNSAILSRSQAGIISNDMSNFLARLPHFLDTRIEEIRT